MPGVKWLLHPPRLYRAGRGAVPPLLSRVSALSSARESPPEVASISEEEFRRSVAGGASALDIGEMGAGYDEMKRFWQARGVANERRIPGPYRSEKVTA